MSAKPLRSLLEHVALAGVITLAALNDASPKNAPASPNRCEPSPEIRQALDALESGEFDRMPPGKARAARVARLRALLDMHPDDFHLLRSLQAGIRGGEEGWKRNLEEYGSLAEQHPGDARFVYLFGRAVLWADDVAKARAQFRRAVELDPAFPWPHLGLAASYSRDPGKNAYRIRENIRSFWKLCPATLDLYAYVDGADQPRFQREFAGRLREILEQRSDREALDYFGTLWALEFKNQPLTGHEMVRAKVREDLLRLRALPQPGEKEWYLTLREGYGLVGDRDGESWAEGEFLSHFAHSGGALDMVMDRWGEAHPYPAGGSPAEVTAHNLARYRESAKWVKQWPEFPWAWFSRLDTVAELNQEVSDREAVATVDGFLKAWKEDSHSIGGPTPSFRVAQIYVDRSIRLEQVPALIEAPLRKQEEALKEDEASPGGARMRHYRQQTLEYSRWLGWPLLTEAYLKRKKIQDARKVVARMEEAVSQAAAIDSAPQKPAVRRGKGKGSRLEEAGDEAKERIIAQAWHRAEMLYWKGRLVEAGKDSPDAWAYYRAALMELSPESRGRVMQTRERIESDARRLWNKLGGTEEGLRIALARTPGESPQVAESVAGGWQDRNLSMPRFEILDLTGKRWTQANLRGKVTFINVWATWCGPCLMELPHLQKLNEEVRGKPGIQLLTFNVDDNPGLVEPFLTKRGFTFVTLPAAGYVSSILEAVGIPRNWIVDREGRLILEQVGFGGEGEQWVRQAKALIEQTAAKSP